MYLNIKICYIYRYMVIFYIFFWVNFVVISNFRVKSINIIRFEEINGIFLF